MKLIFILILLSFSAGCEDEKTCPGNNCSGHGTCLETKRGDFYCDCRSGYTEGNNYSCYKISDEQINNCKPVIYLYPAEPTQVSVAFANPQDVDLTYTYPIYGENGWTVTAFEDGTLWDGERNYYSLYWEGVTQDNISFNTGFCVNSDELIEFFEDVLAKLGLNDFEAQEFIIYWLPILGENPYNIIYFATNDWIKDVPLAVSPAPDTQIRFNMIYRPSVEKINILPQEIKTPVRVGFTLVEWGGRLESGEYEVTE